MIIGLDVGGTHTDVVLLGTEGLIKEIKVRTDPDNLFETVLTGLGEITSGIDPEKVSRMVLSTTLTTNAIVQKKVPEVGMIVSGGPGIDPELFRTNDHYYTVSGSIDHRGREITPIDRDEIEGVAEKLVDAGVSHVGVVTKFSVRNPSQEKKIRDYLGDSFEKIFLGHRISGNLNFPRRIASTYLNAAVYPIHRDFFIAVKKSLKEKGLLMPIRILKADGGNMNFEASIDFPGQTILSGPSASVMGSLAFAPENEECLVLDIGGTTTDMAILIDRVPLLDPLGIEVGGIKTLTRSLETHSVGVGGDSVVRVEDGNILIGPERVGPALAYGGSAPTPTDALVVMGKINTENNEKSIAGLKKLAGELNMSLEDAAFRIFDKTCRVILSETESMIERINSKPVYTVHELLEGHSVKPVKLLVLGGPAPYFAEHLEKLSGLQVGVVPRWHVANAIGAALARTTSEVSLFADTEQCVVTAPGEGFQKQIDSSFTKEDAIDLAYDLLKQKALKRGANEDHLEMELVEDYQFNMIRGFRTTGKNIRVKVQIKPGLIHGYDPEAGGLI